MSRSRTATLALEDARSPTGMGDTPDAPRGRGVALRRAAREGQRRQAAELRDDPLGGSVQGVADRGVVGAGGRLPHAEAIQASFGRHDVGDIQAHVGGAAREASEALGARAYATGGSTAFAQAPDLHLAAHEAAHVVQQRAGVQFDRVGVAGDAHERHADAVADAVVAGRSAEALLDAPPAGGAPVQREAKPDTDGAADAARIDAAKLLAAFTGGGTDEDAVLRVLNQPPEMVRAVRDVYDKDFNTHTGKGLAADLKDELTSWTGDEDYNLAVGLMARAGISIGGARYHRNQADASRRDYKIVADPPVQVAVPGTIVTYTLSMPRAFEHADSVRTIRWSAANDPVTSAKLGKPARAHLGVGVQIMAQASFPGNHKIICRMDYTPAGGAAQPPEYYEFPQTVVPEDKAAADALSKAGAPVDPAKQLELLEAFLKVMKTAAGQPGSDALDPEVAEAYQKQIDALKARLASTEGKTRHPFKAVHVDREQGRTSELRVFAAKMSGDDSSQTWAIVDTTNPTSRRLSGEYEGTGKDARAAISAALAAWDSGNRYPPGRIKMAVGEDAAGEAIDHEFQTDGASFWDSISEFFNEVGFWAGVGAIGVGIVTAIAPVPGSRVVSAAVWTSILATTAAATINIVQRHAEGHASARDDAMDVLTIVGNVLAGAWMRGAKVLVNGRGGVKIATGVLIGQVATDGVQGIILGVEFIQQYDRIMAIKDPQKRSQELMELFRSALLTGGMIVLSVAGTRADMRSLKQSGSLTKLRDPSHTIDLDAAPTTRPKVDGEPTVRPGDGTSTKGRLEGTPLGEVGVKLGGETHAIKLQRFDGELRILLCSDCGPILKSFDDTLKNLEGSSRIDPGTGLRVGVGPQKGLYNRLSKMRQTIARLEADFKANKIPEHKVTEGLNQIASQMANLKKAFPDFDMKCFAETLRKTSSQVPGGSANKKFLETALTGEFDVKAWESFVTKTLGTDERMGAVLAVAEQRAKKFGWVKDSRLSRLNSSKSSKRVVYQDPSSGRLYSVDVQHGRFEMCNAKGKHIEEVDFNLDGAGKTYNDTSHDLRVR